MRFVVHVSSVVIAASSALAQNPFGVPLLATGTGPAWVSAADLDRDGRNDIVCTNGPAGSLSVFESLGRGRFEPAITLSGLAPYGALLDIEFADLDQDGDLDIVTVNETPTSSNVLVYQSDGSGGFATAVPRAVGGPAYACAAGDVDQDTWPDIVVSSGATVRLFRSTGGGNFAAPASLALGVASVTGDVQLGDVDGDGDLDIVAAAGASIVVRVNTGAGTFAPAQPFASDSPIKRTAIGDWNGDGRADIALVDYNGHLDVMLNNGSGAFGAPATIASDPSVGVGIAAGDLDGDGRADLAMTNYSGDVAACLALGGGAFGPPTAHPINGKNGVAIADVDGDGRADILATRNYDARVAIALGDGHGGTSLGEHLAFSSSATQFRVGDLDLDGIQDIVARASNPQALQVRLGLAAGGFGAVQSYPTSFNATNLALARVDGDAYLDALVLGANHVLRILYGNAAGGFGAPVASATLANANSLEARDFDGDAFADLVYSWAYVDTAGYYHSGTNLMHGNGLGGFSFAGSLFGPSGLGFGDFNEDGYDDLAKCESGQVSVTRSIAGGGYTWSPQYPATNLGSLRAADIDGDGHLDIVGCDSISSVVVMLGDGLGALGPATSYFAGNGYARDLAAADFDGDGDVDVTVSYEGWLTYLENLGSGVLAARESCPTAYPSGAVIEVLDANGDGLGDLALGAGGFPYLPPRVMLSRGAVAPPVAYCVAKLTSNGCTPAIGWSGTSSATATGGFTIACSNAINNKNGLLFYSLDGRASLPFQGGTMCVRPPQQRTPLRNSGGNAGPNDCSGNFALDFNAFAHGLAGGNPSPALTTPGIAITAQWWGRDPASPLPGASMLSNALDFLVGP